MGIDRKWGEVDNGDRQEVGRGGQWGEAGSAWGEGMQEVVLLYTKHIQLITIM